MKPFLRIDTNPRLYTYGHGLSVRISLRCSMKRVFYDHIYNVKWHGTTDHATRDMESIDDYARRWSPFQSR